MAFGNFWKIKKSKARTTVLAKQKPSRKISFDAFAKLLASIILTATISVFTYGLWQLSTAPLPQNTVIRVINTSDTRYTSISLVRDLYRKVRSTKNGVSLKELAKTADLHSNERDISLYRPRSDLVLVAIQDRVPIIRLTFKGKKNRDLLLSKSGLLFQTKHGKDVKNIPTLSNIPSFMISKVRRGLYRPSSRLKEVLNETSHLDRALKNNSIKYKKFLFNQFQGFEIELNSEVLVSVGRSPFKDKIGRLKKLIRKFKMSGVKIKRIDLDYRGKAFVTEAKTTNSKKGI